MRRHIENHWRLILHCGRRTPEIDPSLLEEFIRKYFPFIPLEMRGDFYSSHYRGEDPLPLELASIRVADPFTPFTPSPPHPIEIDFEKRRLLEEGPGPGGVLYDSRSLMKTLWKRIDEREKGAIHLICTDELFGDFFKGDGRFHIRSLLCGCPSLISMSGIVEGPARPADFYRKKRMGIPIHILKREFEGMFIDYGSPFINEVAKGMAAQVLFYFLTGNPFCSNRVCRLFNSHLQEDLLFSQSGEGGDFCREHLRLLEGMGHSRFDSGA